MVYLQKLCFDVRKTINYWTFQRSDWFKKPGIAFFEQAWNYVSFADVAKASQTIFWSQVNTVVCLENNKNFIFCSKRKQKKTSKKEQLAFSTKQHLSDGR